MSNKQKSRHKPLYKKLHKLRGNVQNRKKILKFKKKKWALFLFFLRKKSRWFKKPYSHFYYKVSKFASLGNSFQKRFRNNLTEKKRFSYIYGKISRKYLKKNMTHIYNNKKSTDFRRLCLEFFESRLDSVLYRSHFFPSFKTAQQFIRYKCVTVNKVTVTKKSYLLKQGDLIEIKPKYKKFVRENLKQSALWPIPPKYLLINYRTTEIIFGDNTDFNFASSFTARLNLDSVVVNCFRN